MTSSPCQTEIAVILYSLGSQRWNGLISPCLNYYVTSLSKIPGFSRLENPDEKHNNL
jgi:hypothetical protein